MQVQNVELNKFYKLQGGTLTVLAGKTPFDASMDGWKRPAVIVVPGGGYGMTSEREAEPIAFKFLAKGFQVFILYYQCAPDGVRYPEQLLQLACSVDYVRKNAAAYGVNPAEVFAVGFSAGGHLVGNLSTDYTQAVEAYGADLDCKLTASGLCYPVISAVYGHVGSFDNLLKGYSNEEKAELLKKLYLDEIVSEKTSPAFIWATATDQVVPVMNSLKYAEALTNCNIPYEMHIYPWGIHGLSTCDQDINPPSRELQKPAKWIDDCATFFRRFTEEVF